ncbi:MAG: tetratricopeptide repeat protein [Rikenellaceae bacterium]|nr:tetratricopeptide repeat protein [Rikenellaceae bacterium]
MKERGLVRKGNRQFKREQFEKSVDSYQRALQHDSTSFEAKYDLASALYRTERYEKAEKTLLGIVNDTTRTELERGEVAYNLGNTQFAQQKYKEALSSYRQAMRCNPNDEDAKFNYAFTKRLIQQQEQQQQQQSQDQNEQNKDNKEQNQDKQQDQQNQQDKQNENKQDQQQQQPQNQNGKDNQQQQGGERPEGAMTPEQQEALLQAIQAEEDKTQDKLKEKAGVLIRGSKNW